jgi:hypothetical protein
VDLNEFDELMGLNARRSDAGKAFFGVQNELAMTGYRSTLPELSRWQREDGFPSDEYFDEVVDAIQARGVKLKDWWRNEAWEWQAEVEPDSLAGGSAAAHAAHGLHIGWRCDEDDEPEHAEDFTTRGAVNTGWHWVLHTRPGALGDRFVEFDDLVWLAEPSEVALAVLRLVRGEPSGGPNQASAS